MQHVWSKIEELRVEFDLLREDRTPIDVFTFLEVDLGLDPIPFDELVAKYRVEAAIKADFSGIYLDAHGEGTGVEAESSPLHRGP
jgi:hypothetical protein